MRKLKAGAYFPFLPFWIFSLFRQIPVRAPGASVQVVSSRISGALADRSRGMTVITREEIERMSPRSTADILRFGLGADVQERGLAGAQADLSIRGSTFQQVLVLLDGVRFGDLQTAHYNLDIPVGVEAIERIEILRGPASSLYGPDAFGGAVNIVTRNAPRNRASANLSVSDFRTSAASLSLEKAGDGFSNVLSAGGDRSDGFIEDRDYRMWRVSDKLNLRTGRGRLEAFAGYGRKEFGALDFYTPGLGLPSREWTRTVFFNLGYEAPLLGMSFTQRTWFRTHFDRFLLDRKRPAYYENETTNSSLGTDFVFRKGGAAFGGEAERGAIASSKIGNHADVRAALFAEYRASLGRRMIVNLGLRQDYHETYGLSLSPSASVIWTISPAFSWKASAGHSFRAPSYTELYYRDPANEGNPDLRPERAWSIETGWDVRIGRAITAGATLFRRSEKDLIDWIRESAGPWRAANIRRLQMTGLEFEATAAAGIFRLGLKQSWMTAADRGSDLTYKYGFRYPRSQGAILLDAGPIRGLNVNLRLSHKKRVGQSAYAVLDAGASFRVGEKLSLYFNASNLLDADYQDIPGVPLPGRWLSGGIKLDW
ncbi:MAG: TonB-dependent receptor plug domain-containing protein [Candidatus Aminicenantales bacterium]